MTICKEYSVFSTPSLTTLKPFPLISNQGMKSLDNLFALLVLENCLLILGPSLRQSSVILRCSCIVSSPKLTATTNNFKMACFTAHAVDTAQSSDPKGVDQFSFYWPTSRWCEHNFSFHFLGNLLCCNFSPPHLKKMKKYMDLKEQYLLEKKRKSVYLFQKQPI